MDARRKTALALELIVLWGGLAYWQWERMPEPVHVPLTNVAGPASASAPRAGVPKSGGLRVNLEWLASARTQREATFAAPRNIFAMPRPDGTFAVGGESDKGPVEAQVSEEAVPQQAGALEVSQYRYLGFVRMGESAAKNHDIAVLAKNEEVMVGRTGQRLEPHIMVKAITPDSVTLRDIEARTDHTVPLKEDQPVSLTEIQPVPLTGSQPVPSTGSRPVPSTDFQPGP